MSKYSHFKVVEKPSLTKENILWKLHTTFSGSFFFIYIYIYKVALSVCRLFATYRPHPGAALRDRLTCGPPCGRKWTCETRAEEVMRPHTLSVLPCMQHAEGRRDVRRYFFWFREQFTFRVTGTNGRSDDAGEHQSGETPTAYAYGWPALHETAEQWQQGTWRLIAQASTRRARNQESEPPFRRDSRNCWQPEEKEMSVCTRRPLCPESKRPRASERQNRRAGERVVSLEVEFSALSILGKLSLCRGNTWKLTAAQRSFRDWCSGGQETRSAWLPSEPPLWRAAADNSKNRMSKQSPEERTPRSLSHERWSTDDTDILFRGGNTRTLASHSWAVLFQ